MRIHTNKTFLTSLALLLCVCLTQCAVTPETRSFSPVDSENGYTVRKECIRSAQKSNIIRTDIDVEWIIPGNENENIGSLATTCLWNPGKALRLRLRRYGLTVGELLYNGEYWFLADDLEGDVFIIRNIADLRVNGIPPYFLTTLAYVPFRGWFPPPNARVAVADDVDIYRFTWWDSTLQYAAYFHRAAPVPEYAEIRDINGAILFLRFSNMQTGIIQNTSMFAPRYDNYEKHVISP